MDYEKEYKEALERMRNVIIPPETKEGLQALKETVFPELAESEDERIRKMLVEQMERWKKCAEDNNVEQDVKDASTALAWLEKQKEQKPAEWSEEDEKMIDAIIIGYQDRDFRNSQIPTQIGVSKDEVKSWLKSLRPSWKPSEVQLDALWAALGVTDYVAGAWIENGGERSLGMSKDELHERLLSLYKDLKKL